VHQRGNLPVEPLIEIASIGQRCQRVVMREIADVPLRLLARPQIANRDNLMRPPGKIDRPQAGLFQVPSAPNSDVLTSEAVAPSLNWKNATRYQINPANSGSVSLGTRVVPPTIARRWPS
jgi:hypothetical protein